MLTSNARVAPGRAPLTLDAAAGVDRAAAALAAGAVVGHAFANVYVISAKPDAAIVRRVTLMKGRPAGQVGSVTTTRRHIPDLFDWSRLPDGLTRRAVLELMDALFRIGPFGFRGPAATMPAHLTYPDGGVVTTQVIAPGYACPSNAVIARALARISEDFLYITSANRSRRVIGADDEPAHYRADGLAAEFAAEPDFITIRHGDEAAARRAFPLHAPMSTTILAFHRTGGVDAQGRLRLIVERHGSLRLDHLRRIVGRFGFDLVLGPKAGRRLAQRSYADDAIGGAAWKVEGRRCEG